MIANQPLVAEELGAVAKAAGVVCENKCLEPQLHSGRIIPALGCSCLVDGKFTGRKWPELSRECWCQTYKEAAWVVVHGIWKDKPTCLGSGRVPVSGAEALKWLMEQKEFLSLYRSNSGWAAYRTPNHDYGWASTPLLALLAALHEASDA